MRGVQGLRPLPVLYQAQKINFSLLHYPYPSHPTPSFDPHPHQMALRTLGSYPWGLGHSSVALTHFVEGCSHHSLFRRLQCIQTPYSFLGQDPSCAKMLSRLSKCSRTHLLRPLSWETLLPAPASFCPSTCLLPAPQKPRPQGSPTARSEEPPHWRQTTGVEVDGHWLTWGVGPGPGRGQKQRAKRAWRTTAGGRQE